MQSFNHISSAIFDVLLTPFGYGVPAFDLLVWPVVMGVVALVVYKYASNQDAITRVKTRISMHLLEIRLFSHDILQVLRSTGHIVVQNTLYIGHNVLPLCVMLVPMVAILVQLVSHYAYAPTPPGSVELLRLTLDPAAKISTRDVKLTLPKGVTLDAPSVPTEDGRVFWRLRADAPGDHVLRVDVAGQTFEKGWAVGGPPRKVPRMRARGWEAVLYPGEEALPADGPVVAMDLEAPVRKLAFLPDGELGIVMWALVVSLVAGFALRGLFGVTF